MTAKILLHLFDLMIWVGLFASCSVPAASPTPPVATPVAQMSPTTAPTATAAPTNTPLPPTATAIATATSTATPSPTATATQTFTPVPPTATATNTATLALSPTNSPTATRVPPSATRKPPLVPKTATPKPSAGNFTVTWKTGIEYNARDATSFWCQTHNQYQNLSSEVMPFQDFPDKAKMFVDLLQAKTGDQQGGYQPIVGIANPDGTINRWQLAGWYAKAFGWSNGIEKFPPDGLAANSTSDDWTWYGTSNQGEYCKYMYVRWKGQVSVAEYAPDGKLTNTNATLPSGAP